MSENRLIERLQTSGLYAECTHCGGEFKLSKTALFDGRSSFPDIAEQKKKEMVEELKQRMDELKRRKLSAAFGALLFYLGCPRALFWGQGSALES